MKTALTTILMISAALLTLGCDNKTDYVVVEKFVEDFPPPVPQGVYSVTRNEAVLLYWLPIDDVNGDFASYVVYRSDHHPDTGYLEIGRTTSEYFVDYGLTNGHTYYYAVSSVDVDGNLSDLSYEYVLDTPRPQGTNGVLFDFNDLPEFSGWDFSGAAVVDYLAPTCDIFLEYFPGDDVFYLNVATIYTDIQDMGYTEDFDEITYSPEFGWSQNGWLEVILNHTYVIWTEDDHYAKIRVTGIGADRVLFEWAYQVAPDNLELKPRLNDRVPEEYLRHPRQ